MDAATTLITTDRDGNPCVLLTLWRGPRWVASAWETFPLPAPEGPGDREESRRALACIG